jgi:hypothetical protein
VSSAWPYFIFIYRIFLLTVKTFHFLLVLKAATVELLLPHCDQHFIIFFCFLYSLSLVNFFILFNIFQLLDGNEEIYGWEFSLLLRIIRKIELDNFLWSEEEFNLEFLSDLWGVVEDLWTKLKISAEIGCWCIWRILFSEISIEFFDILRKMRPELIIIDFYPVNQS